MKSSPPILYCHCAYADVVAPEVKHEVLQRLVASGVAFDAVADLCQLSAAKDPALQQLAGQPGLQIVACYPRAVRGLFAAAGSPLPDDSTPILNMREQAAQVIAARSSRPSCPTEKPGHEGEGSTGGKRGVVRRDKQRADAGRSSVRDRARVAGSGLFRAAR